MSGSGDQFAIQVRDLVVGFRQQTVIDHLSLDVRKGEILGLVGAPGGGKSVLMRQSAVAAFNDAFDSIATELITWTADAL